jgi:hypothetical protein
VGKDTPDPVMSPVDAQVFREISPVFRDMLRGFQLKLTFVGYAPVFYGPNPRGRRGRSKSVDILHVDGADLDKYGYMFFENEEIMLDLVRWQIGSADVADHLRGYGANLTLPVMTPYGSKHMWSIGYSGNRVYLPPSRRLFDRYFKGKKLDFAQWRASPPEKHVLADFAKIGYHPAPGKEQDGEKATP